MTAIQSPIIPHVAALVRAYPGTISLGQGVVYYGPPPEAPERLSAFLADDGNHKYQPTEGVPELVETLGAKLGAENGIDVGAATRVVVTAGGNLAFAIAVLAIADPGDEIVLQTPYYFNHEMAVALAGCRAVLVSTDNNYQLCPDAIERAITSRTRAVLTVSPNNPTGAVYSETALRRVNTLCRERDIYHISDEAYEYFTYGDARHFSPGSIAGAASHTISLYSLSKAYGMASWRIGYLAVPDALRESVRKIQDTLLICPPVISQFAALGALAAGRAYCNQKRRAIEAARDVVGDALQSLRGICDIPRADGAFYFLLRVATRHDPLTVVERLIREHGVAVLPGTTFGLASGCHLRVAYGALEKETAAEGIGRLVQGLKAIVGDEAR